MFRQVPLYNQPLILLNTSRVTDMSEMFHGARAFNQSLSFNCTFAHTFCNATYFDRSKNYTSRRRLWRETFNSPWPVDIDTSRVTYSEHPEPRRPSPRVQRSTVEDRLLLQLAGRREGKSGRTAPPTT